MEVPFGQIPVEKILQVPGRAVGVQNQRRRRVFRTDCGPNVYVQTTMLKWLAQIIWLSPWSKGTANIGNGFGIAIRWGAVV